MKILIADDAPVSQHLLADFLKPYGDCLVVSDGQAVIDAFRANLDGDGHRYDLICLDIMMPRLNGQDALLEIRKLERDRGVSETGQVKVVMITALDDSEHIMDALVKGGCQGYLTKPVTRSQVQQQLTELGLL
jgi:two-component system chemotaxis response regulator CheY